MSGLPLSAFARPGSTLSAAVPAESAMRASTVGPPGDPLFAKLGDWRATSRWFVKRWAIATASGNAADRPLVGKSVRFWIASETPGSSWVRRLAFWAREGCPRPIRCGDDARAGRRQ